MEKFTTKGHDVQVFPNGTAGFYKSEDPHLEVSIISSTKNNSYKTYYNLLNTLEHEKYHFDDINSMSLDPFKISFKNKFSATQAGVNIQLSRMEAAAVKRQMSRPSWSKTTKTFQNDVKKYKP